MTPSVDIAEDTSALDSSMDDFFTPPPPAPAGGAEGAPPAETEGEAEPVGETAPPEAEAEAAPVEEEAEPAPEAEAAPAPPPPVPGKTMTVDTKRWENVYRDHKFAREIRAFAPDVQTARQHYERFNDMRHMAADFASDNPVEATKFLDYWRTENPEAFDRLVPRAIEAASPEVRTAINQQVLTSQCEEMYSHAAETQDPQDLYKAQMFEWSMSGSYRTKDQIPKVDPLARRATELDQRETRLKTEEQQRAEGIRTEWTQRTDSAITTGLDEGIDKMLAPVAARFAKAPDLLKALRGQVRTQIVQAVKNDREWSRTFQLDYKAAMRQMTPANRDALVRSYLQRANPIMASTARPLIEQATAVLVAASQGTHARLAAAAGQKGPNAPGKPSPQSIKPQAKRGEMSLEEKIDADMDVGLRP